MSNRFPIYVLILAVLLLISSSVVYRVQETERAVRLYFGSIDALDIKPGLHFKLPLAHKIVKVDARILTLDANPESFYTLEKKRLEVDSYAKWRVKDVAAYYRATGGDENRAKILLTSRVNDNLRNEIGDRTLHEVVSGERDQLIQRLTESLNQGAQDDLGIEIIDVRVKRIDLPQEVSRSVYSRMRTDREKEARQYRSEGRELGEKIRADADREKVVIEAEAYRDGEQVRGEGDAQAAAIYAAAYGEDEEFYAFYRRMSAYEESFSNKGDVLLIDPKSDFFRYLNNIDAK